MPPYRCARRRARDDPNLIRLRKPCSRELEYAGPGEGAARILRERSDKGEDADVEIEAAGRGVSPTESIPRPRCSVNQPRCRHRVVFVRAYLSTL